jgi:16S rRNA processing protein RimM
MKYAYIGTIIGTHGIRGEVKVRSETSFREERYLVNNFLYLDYQNQMTEIRIDTYRKHKDFDLISFNGYTNINDVLKYVNCDLYVDRDARQDLDEGEYYFDDLIGLEAVDEAGTHLGSISDILEVPQGQILVLERPDKSEAMIPFADEFIRKVDFEHHKIIIAVIEGLL